MRFLMGLLVVIVALWSAGQDPECLEQAEALRKLQNELVHKSFEKLQPGAWGLYEKGKAVYLGKMRSPFTGKTHHVAQVISKSGTVNEFWYDLDTKYVTFEGKRYPFRYLHLKEGYVSTKHGAFYIPESVIDFYLKSRGELISPILVGVPSPKPDCENRVRLKRVRIKLPSGKRIDGVEIKSLKNGATLYVSTEVPFGIVDQMIDFGWSGGEKAILTPKMRKNAQNILNFTIPAVQMPAIPQGVEP